MPIYEYQCSKCGHVLEVLQRMDENRAGQNCPKCGENNLVKKISAANIGKSSKESHESLCCGRSERLSSCIPGSCCGGHGEE